MNELLPRTEAHVVDRLYRGLAAVDTLLDGFGIPYTVYGGTMLGAVRHGGMAWDDEVDIAIREEDVPTLLEAAPAFFRERGFRIWSRHSWFTVIPWTIARTYRDLPREVDIFPLAELNGRRVLNCKCLRTSWPDDWLLDADFDAVRKIDFGPLRLSCVSEDAAHAYLTSGYGPDWWDETIDQKHKRGPRPPASRPVSVSFSRSRALRDPRSVWPARLRTRANRKFLGVM